MGREEGAKGGVVEDEAAPELQLDCLRPARSLAGALPQLRSRDTLVPMSAANLDVVRSIYEATGRGDFSAADWADPDIELELVDGPSPGRWVGIAGLAEAFSSILSAWDRFRIEADEIRELDAERVLALDRYEGTAKTSGVQLADVQAQGATLFHVQHSKVTKIVIYWERETGLADLGLASGRD